MVLDGQLDSTYACSFIVTDIPQAQIGTAQVERFHRPRAQLEEQPCSTPPGSPPTGLRRGDHALAGGDAASREGGRV